MNKLKCFEVKDANDPKAFRLYFDSFKKGCIDVTGEQFTYEDAMSVPHASVWLPKVITTLAREAAEPNLVLTQLFDQVDYQPGLQIVHGASGALEAADIAEGEAYPEQQLQIGGGTVTASVDKSGVAFKYTEEMRRNSVLDVARLHVEAAGRALARHKEQKAATFLSNMGITVFDNENPATSSAYLGVTHGRDENGNANGSITPNDMFDLFGTVINNGFMPNLLIIHPLTWVMFMKDPVLRAFALAGGNANSPFWGTYRGNPAGRAPWGSPQNGQTSGQNINPNSSDISAYSQANRLNSAPNFPSYFLPFPFQTVVSPFVYYDPQSKLTDIIVADRAELGAYIVDEPVNIDEWSDPSVDIHKVKLRERYGFQIYHEGLAIALAKNVRIDPNSIVLPATAMIDASSMPTIGARTPVV